MSGLTAAQTAISTIDSNIANAKVESYHRQAPILATDCSNNMNGVKVSEWYSPLI
ncbi:MAG: flagellar basal body protein [Arsenophonus endosymbiont of Dermacentor nuttalli]